MRDGLLQHDVQNIQDDFVVLIMTNVILPSAIVKYSESAGTSSSSGNYLCRGVYGLQRMRVFARGRHIGESLRFTALPLPCLRHERFSLVALQRHPNCGY